MKYLFLVNESESANGICVRAVMRQLAPDNTVCCITNAEHGRTGNSEEDGIRYYRIKPRLTYRISSYLSRGRVSRGVSRLLRLINTVLNKTKLILTVGIWPWIAPMYTDRIYRKALDICRAEGIDCIVATYSQIDTLIAADKIKKQMQDITYIPYFLDSLSGGYGPKQFSPEWTVKRGLKWEKRLLNNADAIIFMKSSLSHHLFESTSYEYYNRVKFLDLPLFDTAAVGTAPENMLMNPEKTNLLYVGTLPPGIRSPEYVLETFSNIRDDSWQLYFIGTADNAALNAAAAEDSRIHVLGRISHAEAVAYEQAADALINIGNSNSHMLPSKIFEYFAAGRPVISVNALTDDKCNGYLEEYPASLIIDTNTTEPSDAAASVEAFINKNRNNEIDPETVKQQFYGNTPEATAEFIEKTAKRGGTV